MKRNIQKVSEAKYKENPFLGPEVLTIPRSKGVFKVGKSEKLIVDEKTGEIESIAAIYGYEERDKEGFKKIFVAGIRSMMDMSATGTKAFAFILDCLRINEATIYINIPKMAESCKWKTTSQCYSGLGELIANKIVAPSEEPNLWFINPKFVFNGDRLLFMKEYRIKKEKEKNNIEVQRDQKLLQSNPELFDEEEETFKPEFIKGSEESASW